MIDPGRAAGAGEAGMRRAALAAMDAKTKPPGSLGRLEALAVELATIQRTLQPMIDPARVLVFAADHGVTAEGVSAYPAEVTAQMMANFAAGGAAVTVLARAFDAEVEVIDVGVAANLGPLPRVIAARVRCGSRNLAVEPALTMEEAQRALEVGRAAVERAVRDGCCTIALGEMGIGNSTAAAALLSALTGAPPDLTVGRGTGVDDAGLARKRDAIGRALALHGAGLTDPLAALAALGGLDIAAMAGAASEGAQRGMVVVVDGFIATVAALAATRLDPAARAAMIFAHRSAEAGHGLALDALSATPLLDLGMRLGEGTGAVLALPLLRAACAILRDMATFESAGVSDRTG